MKAILIDSEQQEIRQVEYHHPAEWQRLIGGPIQLAHAWPNGDVLYVDEEGLLHSPRYFFAIPERTDQLLAGNGLIVGPEINHEGAEPPSITVQEVQQKVLFAVPFL